jgi:flagellar biosynthetic protein FlhB
MADDDDKESKTEDATEKKIRNAIEEGNVPASREAATLASFIAMFMAGSFMFAGNVLHLQNSLMSFIDNPGGWRLESGADAIAVLHLLVSDAARLLVPVVLLLLIAGVGAGVLQNPPQLVTKRIAPDFSRISLQKGWGRLFSLRGLVEFGKSLFKLTAVAIVGFLVLKATQSELLASMFMEPVTLPALIRKVLLRIVGWVALLTLALVVADLFWSHFSWRKELRMTKQEVKDEFKQSEGDPNIKGRIRALARDRARRRMMASVPRATVVVANPTHYAVAMRYVREEGGAPLVLAKGRDLVALQIREIAENHGIPIIEDKPLARSLYDSVEVDKLIPPQFYKAVAEIIFFLHTRKTHKYTGGTKS